MPVKDDDDDDDLVHPFEWLTSAESLKPKLQQALANKEDVRVLHVGCGSSVLGEFLVENFSNVAQVVNVDNDKQIVQAMQNRWTKYCCQRRYDEKKKERMKFIPLDLCQESIPEMDGSFDLVLDKSTLDCLLCSEKGASCLISETHRLLDPKDGVYLLISFHHIEMLLPLLQDCPGTDWKGITHSVVYRHVETLGGKDTPQTVTNLEHVPLPEMDHHSSPWTSGGFQPDEVYHRTLNVLICRKQGNQSIIVPLDSLAVYGHVNLCSDLWYQQQNPMLTPERTHQIRQAFNIPLPLSECYSVLFTEEEREHLTYEAFLEDWSTFLDNHTELAKDEVSSETALCFLSEMQ
eukprot:scaffold41762_cov191-Amphora_coffeaeformis.AAC.1